MSMIKVDNLGKAYRGHPVLRAVSLQVEPGQVLALVGPNGAGKSTTLRILAGIVTADAGAATINGVPAGCSQARRSLGYLPQKPGVANSTSLLSLARLVTEVRGLPSDSATRLLADCGFSGRMHATIGELSGGQRQRLMLALATVGPVTALLLDEPGISLDADGADDAHLRIREARARGTAVLFTSHHLADVAALADRIAVMVEGVVIAQGTPVELARRAGMTWNPGSSASFEAVYRYLVTRSRSAVKEVA
jgi:ABC-2 type transport system ATP-binding protein